jgi:hypothetical protein
MTADSNAYAEQLNKEPVKQNRDRIRELPPGPACDELDRRKN